MAKCKEIHGELVYFMINVQELMDTIIRHYYYEGQEVKIMESITIYFKGSIYWYFESPIFFNLGSFDILDVK